MVLKLQLKSKAIETVLNNEPSVLSIKLVSIKRGFIVFLRYSTSNIILRTEMSTVNLKIVFLKKQKQASERPTRDRGATSSYNKNKK